MPRCTLATLAVLTLPALAAGQMITGADTGGNTHVKVFDASTGTETRSFLAYSGFTGAVRVGGGDLTGEGVTDLITGAGPGAVGGHVKVFNGQSGAEIRSFFAYPGFTGGVYVSGGDINRNRITDIITGADAGAVGGHVKVFDGQTNAELRSFFAYVGFTGGVRVGAADINRDGFADIVTGAGPGAVGGHVKVFDGQTNAELRSFFAYPGFSGGIFVAGGDVNRDGFDDVIVGTDGGNQVKVFDGQTNAEIRSFLAYGAGFTGGVRVGAADVNGDGFADIITGAGPGATGGHVKVFDGQNLSELRSFLAYPGFNGGLFVAGNLPIAVPEPSSAALLALGGLGMALGFRRRRR